MHQLFRFAVAVLFLLTAPALTLARLAPATEAKGIVYAIVTPDKPLVWADKIKLEQPGTYTVRARLPFRVVDPVGTPLIITASEDVDSFLIDDTVLPLPLPEMRYRTLTGVTPPGEGSHMLAADWKVNVRKNAVEPSITLQLREQTDEDLAITSGPIVNQLTDRSFTVTCRTTLAVPADLQVGDRHLASASGFLHSFKVDGLTANQAQKYLITAQSGDRKVQSGPYEVRTLPNSGGLTFAATGDTRTNPKVWGAIANDILKHKPYFFVHTGDYVVDGRLDVLWEEGFCAPGRELLATTGIYGVLGNHEQHAPLFEKLFPTPSGDQNWSQAIGPMLLIGIDGADPAWAPESDKPGARTQWLEGILQQAKQPYIFVLSHYPPRSSGSHGDDKTGSTIILPLLQKYHATAIICGHDHIYERSEPANGTTVLVTGGGGAPLYKASHKNPDSKVFQSVYSYAIFNVDSANCSMTVYDVDNNKIDERAWQPRPEASAETK